MSLGRGLVLSVLLACAVGAFPDAARAETMAEREAAAQALYDRATALMDANDFAAACPKLEEVTTLVPEGLGARLTLAECYEKSGKLASAWTQYAMIAPRAARAGQAARQAKAEAKMAELAPKVAKLTLRVDPSLASITGFSLVRDGVEVGKAQWDVAVPIDAGEHVIEARAPGKLPMRRELHVDDATTPTLTIDALTDAPVEKPIAPIRTSDAPRSRPSEPEKPQRSWQAPTGFVVGGLGLASASLGFVLGGLAVGKASDASLECDRNLVCNARGLGLRKEGRTLANASTGLLVVGGVLTGTGIVLLVTAPRSKSPRAAMAFGPGSVELDGEF